jgi:hypothetical protein
VKKTAKNAITLTTANAIQRKKRTMKCGIALADVFERQLASGFYW